MLSLQIDEYCYDMCAIVSRILDLEYSYVQFANIYYNRYHSYQATRVSLSLQYLSSNHQFVIKPDRIGGITPIKK